MHKHLNHISCTSKQKNIIETSKTVEIQDRMKQTRYIIKFHPYINNEGENYQYIVQVYNCWYQPASEIISDMFFDYSDAFKTFNYYVDTYSKIVDFETQDCSNINFYKDKINYRPVHVPCCATCKFSKFSKHFGIPILECQNYKQYAAQCVETPETLINKQAYLPIKPIVQPLYICDGYEG